MRQGDQILFGLERAARAGADVELLNGYKGLPIITTASLVKVGDGLATLKVQKRQAACLGLEGHTYILCAELDEAASATVVELDKAAGTVALANFLYAGRKIGERAIVRVEPKESGLVTIRVGGQTLNGGLIDISMDGVGVHLATPGVDHLLKRQTTVQASFQLPNAQLEFSGTVVYLKTIGDSFRAGIDFSQASHLASAVTNYISQRRTEILNELDMV
ncbi:MAG: PilZ domain-containing protein [Chloroflexi bacterium]|nr:PilZ domain-containing protein [Chloroflexota bacterium]